MEEESGLVEEILFGGQSPDISDLMDEESGESGDIIDDDDYEPTDDWVIIMYHDEQEILRLPAKASSAEELRENYIKMFGRINASQDVKVRVYRKDTQGYLHLVAEHLF